MSLSTSQPHPLKVPLLVPSFPILSLPEFTSDGPVHPQPALRVPAPGSRKLGYLSRPRVSSKPDRLTSLARAGQLKLAGRGHEMGPVLDGAREAGPVDPADAWRDGRQLSLAAPVAEPLAGGGDILLGRWESGSQG